MRSGLLSGLRRWVARDKGMKALCLLLAMASWYAVRTVIGVTRVISDVPVAVRPREGTAVLSQFPRTVSVTFQGSAEDIAQLDQPDVKAQLQVVVHTRARGMTGRETVPLFPRNVEGVKDVRAIRIGRPAEVTVDLDWEGQKQVPVKADIRSQPEVGRLASVVCAPASLRVRGPRRKLEDLVLLQTEPIDVDRVRESFEKVVRVVPSAPWISRVEPPEVTVSVTVEHAPVMRRFLDLPVTAMVRASQPVQVDVRPTRVHVVVTGSQGTLDRLTKDDLRVVVDCSDLEPSTRYDLPLSIQTPPGMDITAMAEPAAVQVTLRRAAGP